MSPSAPPTTNFLIRRAGPDDLPAAMALVEAVWSLSNSEMLPAETLAALTQHNSIANIMASRSQDLWLAESGNTLAGVMGVNADGYLWACYVDPAFQRMGVASALTDAAVSHFRAKGLTQLSLDLIDGNAPAVAFYTARGWVEQSRRSETLPGHEATVIRYEFNL